VEGWTHGVRLADNWGSGNVGKWKIGPTVGGQAVNWIRRVGMWKVRHTGGRQADDWTCRGGTWKHREVELIVGFGGFSR
jgi:hypothetical protein